MEISTFQILILGETLGERGLTLDDRVAIVVSKHPADFEFFETVIVNRGWGNVRMFQAPREAREWLTKM